MIDRLYSTALSRLLPLIFITLGYSVVALAQNSQITVYDGPGYSGEYMRLSGQVNNLGDYAEEFNDRISSIKIRGGSWEVCTDSWFEGYCQVVSGNVEQLSSRFDNHISSLREVSGPVSGGVQSSVIYQDINFGGASMALAGPIPELSWEFSRQISSLQLNGPWEVCEGRNFSGRCRVFSGTVANLITVQWNDRIVSMRPDPETATASANSPRITLFEHSFHRGAELTIVNNTANLGDFGRRASSLRIESGRWQLCSHTGFTGHCRIYDGEVANLENEGFNDHVGSLRPVGNESSATSSFTLYSDSNYRGNSFHFEKSVDNLISYGADNSGSSITVRKGIWELCDGSGFRPPCRVIRGDIDNLDRYGFNDRISSLRRLKEPRPNTGIQVYADADFRGYEWQFTQNVPSLDRFFLSNQISSFRIYNGEWEACLGENYTGSCYRFVGDEKNLDHLNINDRIRSLRQVGNGAHLLIFEHSKFRGKQQAIMDQQVFTGWWRNQISSFQIRGGGRWELCLANGQCQVFSQDTRKLDKQWNDRIVSARRVP